MKEMLAVFGGIVLSLLYRETISFVQKGNGITSYKDDNISFVARTMAISSAILMLERQQEHD
jgi:hypothetical protein